MANGRKRSTAFLAEDLFRKCYAKGTSLESQKISPPPQRLSDILDINPTNDVAAFVSAPPLILRQYDSAVEAFKVAIGKWSGGKAKRHISIILLKAAAANLKEKIIASAVEEL